MRARDDKWRARVFALIPGPSPRGEKGADLLWSGGTLGEAILLGVCACDGGERGRAGMKDKMAIEKSGAQLAFARWATALAVASVGAAAVGAVAIGAFAIGRLSIRRVAVEGARIKRLRIDELEVGRLTVDETNNA